MVPGRKPSISASADSTSFRTVSTASGCFRSTVTLFFPPSTGLRVSSYEAGMVAEEDVIASLSFAVPKTLDELGFERSSAALAVPPTFELDPGAADSTAVSLTRFFEAVDPDYRQRDKQEALRVQRELLAADPDLAAAWQRELEHHRRLGRWTRRAGSPFRRQGPPFFVTPALSRGPAAAG